MFETLSKAPQDKIFSLMAEIAADDRPNKIDLGIGVYKDDLGNTPIMTAVKKAEARILETATTKTYLGVAGNKGFCEAVIDLALAKTVPADRIRAVQAPGGTGSLWVLLSLLKRAKPNATIWISDPTWANHKPMAETAGFTVKTYPYFDPETRSVRFDDLIAQFEQFGSDDIVLLHGCCHNPTGANLTNEQWDTVAEVLVRRGAFPFVDLAYQGFGDGLEEDTYGIRAIAKVAPEFVAATSCSKNFGLYQDRIGAAILVAKEKDTADIAQSQLLNVVRGAYSQPPNHGAEIVRLILTDPELRKEWQDELEAMRQRMLSNRTKLASAVRTLSNSSDFDFVADHRGMFSLLGLSAEAVQGLKASHGVYMLGDSRINIAGLSDERIQKLAEAIVSVA